MLFHDLLCNLGVHLAVDNLGLIAKHHLNNWLLFAQTNTACLCHRHAAHFFCFNEIQNTLHRVTRAGSDSTCSHGNDHLDVAGRGFHLFLVQRFLANALKLIKRFNGRHTFLLYYAGTVCSATSSIPSSIRPRRNVNTSGSVSEMSPSPLFNSALSNRKSRLFPFLSVIRYKNVQSMCGCETKRVKKVDDRSPSGI